MATSVFKISELFWNERIWLPPNVTWTDLNNLTAENASYASFSYLWYPLPAALLLIAIRTFFTQHVVRPMGIAMGLRQSSHKRAPYNELLESVFSQRRGLSGKQIEKFATQLGMSEREVERWLRKRKLQDRPTTLEKFSETG